MSLFLPEGSVTAGSAALVWDAVTGVQQYIVYRNGRKYKTTLQRGITLRDLVHERAYLFEVTALCSGRETPCGNVTICSKEAPREFDAVIYGAQPDGVTDATAGVQKAIDACTPGGLVYLAAGRYLCGSLQLKSNMQLYLARGAVLCPQPGATLNTPPERPMHDIVLHGSGQVGMALDLRRVRRLCLRDLHFTAPATLTACRDLTLDGALFGDALALEGCSRALALGCQFAGAPPEGLAVVM